MPPLCSSSTRAGRGLTRPIEGSNGCILGFDLRIAAISGGSWGVPRRQSLSAIEGWLAAETEVEGFRLEQRLMADLARLNGKATRR
jgi:hypothetical protein